MSAHLDDHLEFDLGFNSENEHSPVHKKRKHDNDSSPHNNDSIKNAFKDPNDVYFGDEKEKFMVKHIKQIEPFPLMNTWTIPSPINTVKTHRTYTKRKIENKPNTSSKRRGKTGGKRKTGGKGRKRKTCSKK
jgi:hypothetical protein